MEKAEIIRITKKEIKCVKTRNKKKYLISSLFAISIVLIISFSFSGESLKSMLSKVNYVYNPVNSLYNDNSSAIFTSGVLVDKESLNFIIPIKSSAYHKNDNGEIVFDVINSIMVMACEDGVVEDVGFTLNGNKFIKIRHTLNVYSVIENVDIAGVFEGDIVKKGQDIATSQQGKQVMFRLYDNEIMVSNLKINQSKIIWER